MAFFLEHDYWPVVARHTCDNPPCCNPAHILDGSHGDNMQDSIARGRFHHGSRGSPGTSNGRAKVTVEQVVEIRQRVAQGETHQSLAQEYGVSYVQIRNIASRKQWTHIP